MVKRFYDLFETIKVFLRNTEEKDLLKEMEEETFEETVAYFADIFDKLNIVNLKLQGKEGNILDLRATITGLGNKLKV